jgi:hypothetical protein
MKKTSAVEWLEQIIYDDKEFSLLEVFEQAKEKEKQQIIDAWFDGISNWDNEKEAEQYYEQTYGKGI